MLTVEGDGIQNSVLKIRRFPVLKYNMPNICLDRFGSSVTCATWDNKQQYVLAASSKHIILRWKIMEKNVTH